MGRGMCLRKICRGVLLVAAVTSLIGCVERMEESEKLRNPEYVVIEKEDVPEELLEMITATKEEPFHLTYADQGALYLAEGYGEQETTGYSVSVTELSETADTVHIHTRLMGPAKGEETKEILTYPYVVVKLEYIDKTVVFD